MKRIDLDDGFRQMLAANAFLMKNLKPGHRRCICRTCGEGFTGIGAFDKHRTGKHAENRRCMSVGEMYEAGMRENADGYWKEDDTPYPGNV